MSREWKSGDVAMVTLTRRDSDDPPTTYLAFFGGSYGGWRGVLNGESVGSLSDNEDTFDIVRRPLVVIDPEDLEQVAKLHKAFTEAWGGCAGGAEPAMAEALRSLVAAPKPEEPLGLGAVVEDENGERWIRVDWVNPWCIAKPHQREPRQRKDGRLPRPEHGAHVSWAHVPAVRVLSEGVTP